MVWALVVLMLHLLTLHQRQVPDADSHGLPRHLGGGVL